MVSVTDGKGTFTSSASVTPRRSNCASSFTLSESISTPFFSATLCVMTLVQPISDAISVSVGVRPWLVPPRSAGSSMVLFRSRTETSVRECEAHLPSSFMVTTVFAFGATVAISVSSLCASMIPDYPLPHASFRRFRRLPHDEPRRRALLRRAGQRVPETDAQRNRFQQLGIAPGVVPAHRNRARARRHGEHAGVDALLLEMASVHEVVDEECELAHLAAGGEQIAPHLPAFAR